MDKKERIEFQVTTKEKLTFQAEAERRGETLSQWLRELARAETGMNVRGVE